MLRRNQDVFDYPRDNPRAAEAPVMADAAVVRFLKELRRRRVFRTAGLYVVGAWLVLQAATMLFPGWGVPAEAIRFLFWAILLGFPVALVFGWIFEVTPDGIRRTRPEWSAAELEEALPLGRKDYLILAAFVIVVGLIVYDATGRVLRTAVDEEPLRVAAELMENSVAVLPFASLSADPEHEYFADGISEEILNRLSAFGELTVIARTSSFTFKDSGYDIARISGLLGVEYLLQGSIRRDNGQIRIAAQLVDHRGAQLWTQTFDREFGAIFALQDEIAEAVATSIMPRIAPPPPIAREPDLEAYQEYLMGREILTRRPSGFAHNSFEYFSRAIELDPDYAEAYAARAISQYFIAQLGGGAVGSEAVLAQADIDMALILNPNLGQAYAAQGLWMEIRQPGAHAEREAVLRRALKLDPNQPDAMNWLAGAVRAQGRLDEADEILRRALRIDPLHAAINLNLALGVASRGDFAAAERQFRRLVEVPRPGETVLIAYYRFQLNTGQIGAALEHNKRIALQDTPSLGNGFGLWRLANSYAMLGMAEQAEHWLARTERVRPGEFEPLLWRSWVLGLASGLLDYPEALAEFRAALVAHGVRVEELHPNRLGLYVTLLALSGEFEELFQVLPSNGAQSWGFDTSFVGREAMPSVAWAYLRTGNRDRAMELIEPMLAGCREREAAGRLHLGYDFYDCALVSLLAGEEQAALDLLDQAAEAGWRGYYRMRRDPRWDAVRDEPKFQAIMARVKADLDAQRAEVEAIEADDDFKARLDAAIAAYAVQAGSRE
jgi:TolB-like protein/tetratricopeptide (TPR) repeat protein